MNALDIIALLTLAVAIWNGWKQGFILQILSLAGVVAGIYLAAHYGAAVGRLLHLDAEIAAPVGFVTVLVLTVLVVAIVGRIVRKVFHFAGFGIADTLLGIAVSVLKYMLLLGALFTAFDRLNADYTLVSAQTVSSSRSYRPLKHLSEGVLPSLKWIGEQVPKENE